MTAIGWIAALALVGAGKGQDRPAAPTFAQVVTEAFDGWDLNHDGILQQEEVWKAAFDPGNQDVKGAALAAVTHWYSMDPQVKSLPKSFFVNYKPQKFDPLPKETPPEEAKRIGRERAMAGTHLQREFLANLWRIRHTRRILFEPSGPKLSDVHQGGYGDCWLISHFGALVHRDPEEVRRMIKETDKGYRIEFPDEVTVELPPLTDAQIGFDDVRMDHGLWVRVLRIAFYRRPKVARRDGRGRAFLYEAKAMEGLTGFRLKAMPLINGYYKTVPDEQINPIVDSVRKELVKTLAAKKLVALDSGRVPLPFGMTGGHSFAVFDFDPASDTVTLWNPWGDDYYPKPRPNGEVDYMRRGGVFTVPLRVMVRSFSQLLLEQYDLYRRG